MRRAETILLTKALYEIKLISLLYLRAFLDDTIEEFKLAANVDQMDLFGDVWFKAKLKEDNPLEVFIQARYKQKKNITLINYLEESFCSYLKIREQSDPSNGDLFLKGTFNATDCFFVIYTNSTIDFPSDTDGMDDISTNVIDNFLKNNHWSGDRDISVKLKDLIGTGGTDERIYLQDEHVQFVCEVAMKNQMISLANRIAKFLNDDGNFQMLLTDETMLLYHVVLAQKVVKVSDIHPDGHRIATFRREFFDTKEKYLTIFKDTLIKEVQNKQIIKSTNQNITELLSTLHFRVPIAFGNLDLIIRGSDAKIEKRINYLASKIYNYNLLEKLEIDGEFKTTIVKIKKSIYLPERFLRLKGGIAGAIGNVFVLDENSKLMKITDKTEQLEPLAKKLYTKIKNRVPNLHEFKFYFNDSKFPKLTFNVSQHEENLIIDFLDRLVLYHNQADLDNVENILRIEIGDYQRDQLKYIQNESDVTFLRYCDQIQKWWMSPKVAPVLTRKSNLLKIEDTLMRKLNANYMSEMKQYNYTFTQLAVSSLNLKKLSKTIIITENSILSVVKVIQHLDNKAHVVLSFEHIANLQINDLNMLRGELKYTNHDKVLILVCDDIQHEKIDALEIFTVRNGNMIIVTNQTTLKTVQKYFEADNILQDTKLSLIDLSEESQITIFRTAKVIVPGVEEEIQLNLLLQGWPKPQEFNIGAENSREPNLEL